MTSLYTRDGLEAYSSETSASLRAAFPWMPEIIWTARIPDGPHLHAGGDTPQEAVDNWRRRHGDPVRFIEAIAA